MFENFKRNRKLNAFRKREVTCKEYNPGSHVIELAAGKYRVSLAVDLIEFDGKLQLAFSGDLIASDGEALARVMKTMWNEVLPQFGEDKEMRLREQLAKLPHPVSPEPVETGFEGNEGALQASAQEAELLYFRDMADYVAGMPNVVTVTVKTSWQIDNK